MKQKKIYFITAIGTDSGKTLISSMITEALEADYWKPVQSGIDDMDRKTVQSLISNTKSVFHNEAYLLESPESPHSAAKKDGVKIEMNKINTPTFNNDYLIVEGAGGLMVPLNDKDLVIDIANKIECEIILVSNVYLGSINHTLLSVNELKRRGLNVKGIIFNGEGSPEAKEYILKYSKYQEILHIPVFEEVNKNAILEYSSIIKKILS